MILSLPLTADAAQRVVTQLGAVKYQLDARYNDRSGVWQLDLTDAVSQVPLVLGIALVIGVDLLAPYELGIGRLYAYDENGKGQDAGADDLGTRVSIYWVSADD